MGEEVARFRSTLFIVTKKNSLFLRLEIITIVTITQKLFYFNWCLYFACNRPKVLTISEIRNCNSYAKLSYLNWRLNVLYYSPKVSSIFVLGNWCPLLLSLCPLTFCNYLYILQILWNFKSVSLLNSWEYAGVKSQGR